MSIRMLRRGFSILACLAAAWLTPSAVFAVLIQSHNGIGRVDILPNTVPGTHEVAVEYGEQESEVVLGWKYVGGGGPWIGEGSTNGLQILPLSFGVQNNTSEAWDRFQFIFTGQTLDVLGKNLTTPLRSIDPVVSSAAAGDQIEAIGLGGAVSVQKSILERVGMQEILTIFLSEPVDPGEAIVLAPAGQRFAIAVDGPFRVSHSPVPEPTTMVLALAAAAAVLCTGRRGIL